MSIQDVTLTPLGVGWRTFLVFVGYVKLRYKFRGGGLLYIRGLYFINILIRIRFTREGVTVTKNSTYVKLKEEINVKWKERKNQLFNMNSVL